MLFTASIVTYKTDIKELYTVISCLDKSNVTKIYIIDNSPCNTLKIIEEWSTKIEYIYGQGNIGYGSAHNIAIKQSIIKGAQYHIVLNSDIYFENKVIEDLTEYMTQRPNIGLVMPKIVNSNGELQYLCKLLPSPFDLIGRRFIPIKNYISKRNYHFEMRASGYECEMDVPFLSGCFMFFRMDALQKVNGFDDNFFMYCEDIDLCRRIGMQGFRTVYYPNVSIIHIHKKESFKSKNMLKLHILSAIKYFNKWGWFIDPYRRKTNKKISSQYINK